METKKIIEVDSVESLSNDDTIFVNSNNSLKQILKSNLTTDGKSAYAYAVEGGNMALEAGKYYSQDGAVYLCTRDTVSPVYSALADLVGLYVERA